MSMRVQFGKAIVLVVMLLTAACRTQNITLQNIPVTVNKVPVRPIELPRDATDSLYARLFDRESVVHFYRTRNFKAVWFDSLRHSTTAADSMMSFVRNIRYFGLLPGRYHLREFEQLKNSRGSVLHRTNRSIINRRIPETGK